MRRTTRTIIGTALAVMSVVAVACVPPPPLIVVTRVGGTGTLGYSGDGGPATAAQFGFIYSIAVDSHSNVYAADYNVVRKITSDGIVSTVANIRSMGLAVDADDNLYISSSFEHRVYRLTPAGVLTVVAGGGVIDVICGRLGCVPVAYTGNGGDGGPAVGAQIMSPEGVEVGTDGSLYIAESPMHKVRKVKDGVISTYAGTGVQGSSGDDGPATSATMNRPNDLAMGDDGVLYIADEYNERVREVAPDGTITTTPGSTGFGARGIDVKSNVVAVSNSREIDSIVDGVRKPLVGRAGASGPLPLGDVDVADAELDSPYGVEFGPDGSLFIGDSHHYAVRRMWPGGAGLGGWVTDGSQGVPGVTVRLYDADDRTTPVAVTTTDGTGYYRFQTLTGDYVVEFVGNAAVDGEWWSDAATGPEASTINLAPTSRVSADAVLTPA